MTEQIRNPKLRFRDNKGNDYSPWNLYSIKDVAKISSGKSKKNENKGRYIIMDMGTVTKNGTMLTHKITPYENDLLKKGDLVMVKDDIGGGHIIGKTIFIPESQKYVLGDHVYRLEPKNYDGLFLHYCINSPIVNRSLKRKVTGSAQLGLNRKSVEEELIKVPRLEEQEKIGRFFSKLDRQIELEEQKLAKLEEQKKGYMQKIFSQELRFKDENGKDYPAWEIKKLGDLYKYQQGQQIPVENQYKIQINNMKRFIRIVDVTENPKKRYIKDRKESGLINQKDLIMIRYGASAGTISMGYEGVIANNLFKFVKKQNVDNRYFYFLLKKSHFKIKSLSSQSAMPALNFNAMDTLKFSIPQYSEQQKIGGFFSELDKLVEKQNQKIDGLKERKKGFLQKMFV